MSKCFSPPQLCFCFFFLLLPCLVYAQFPANAILQYSLSDLDPTISQQKSYQEKNQTKSPAQNILDQLISRTGKKEQKIIRQLLKTGQEQKLLNLQKINKQLNKIDLNRLTSLFNNLKALKLKKFDLQNIEQVKTAITDIDQQLKKLKVTSKEFGDLSFFAGLARDRLANVEPDKRQNSQLRTSAIQNYQNSVKTLAKQKDPASQEKIEDAQERIVSLQQTFGNIIPIAPKKGRAKIFITSDYGMRIHPVKKTKKFHAGVDLAGWKCNGWKVKAIGPGRVIKSGWETGYGYVVIVSHDIEGNQYFSRYAHLQKKNRLKNGKVVKRGDLLGYCNNSGISTGAHLHFEIRLDSYSGDTLDPKEHLPKIQILN